MWNRFSKTILLMLLVIILSGCVRPSSSGGDTQPTEYPTLVPLTLPTFTPAPTQAATPTEVVLQSETIMTQAESGSTSDSEYNAIPNLWSRIAAEYISIYPYDNIFDYTFAKDGSLWMVGNFGIIHEATNGEQTWYSIKNGLTKQYFTTIAISPKGVVWAGGTEKALYWFDGEQWVSEGENLPISLDERSSGWGSKIEGIDFAPDGSTWVVTSEVEVYAQVYGSWVNIPFRNILLPVTGGGYPMGLLVQSENDITILASGCCMSGPSSFHFDGESWEKSSDYTAAVQELVDSRHQFPTGQEAEVATYHITATNLTDHWPFDESFILSKFLYPDEGYKLTTYLDGNVWLRETWQNLYNNSSGAFRHVDEVEGSNGMGLSTDPLNFSESIVLDFGSQLAYFQEEKLPETMNGIVSGAGDGYGFDPDFFVDVEERVWFYDREYGLVMVDQGKPQKMGLIPDNIKEDEIGGTYVFEDGRVWIGGWGEIWEYRDGNWQRQVFSEVDDVFEYFAEDSSGNVYAAAGSKVLFIEDTTYSTSLYIFQDRKPLVIPADGEFGEGTFHTYYADAPSVYAFPEHPKFHYEPRYLGVLQDGSVIYVNNRMIAKLEDGKWKSFYFDIFEFDSVTVDIKGNIWIFSDSDGLFSIDGDCFEAFVDVDYP